ncbi:hypothetical protein EJP82_26435 [Paenibacillus anaericanus]|uniref:Uncharacterized protein n=1 Tax=Paenibacillus anaericanus TaxID=170367 RepID=A0A3S1DH86_9BACL|nr:hypothetical protein [Paenibacillus anaericanus]RUT39237.1 hypothetical protein EJP82_26435 [Paenibacillus anaericanus]
MGICEHLLQVCVGFNRQAVQSRDMETTAMAGTIRVVSISSFGSSFGSSVAGSKFADRPTR